MFAVRNMTHTNTPGPALPPLPPVDLKQQIPYSSIRYVAGFGEAYVHEYARSYALKAVEAYREDAERWRFFLEAAGGLPIGFMGQDYRVSEINAAVDAAIAAAGRKTE